MIVRRLVNLAQERVRRVERRRALNRLVGSFLPSGLPMSSEAARLLSQLQDHGNVLLPELASTASLHALRSALAQLPCYDAWRPRLPDFSLQDTPPDTNNARIRGVRQIEQAHVLANHPLVLQTVSGYLGCKPTIDDLIAWWSLPGRAAPREEQFFHRDTDAVGFVKLFVYLGEVAEDDGAHVFITGSHRENTFLQRRRRFSDEEIAACYPAARRQPVVGAFGTAFLEDTFGLHKGTVPLSRPRLIFQVRYTTYPGAFARTETLLQSGRYDPYINRLIA